MLFFLYTKFPQTCGFISGPHCKELEQFERVQEFSRIKLHTAITSFHIIKTKNTICLPPGIVCCLWLNKLHSPWITRTSHRKGFKFSFKGPTDWVAEEQGTQSLVLGLFSPRYLEPGASCESPTFTFSVYRYLLGPAPGRSRWGCPSNTPVGSGNFWSQAFQIWPFSTENWVAWVVTSCVIQGGGFFDRHRSVYQWEHTPWQSKASLQSGHVQSAWVTGKDRGNSSFHLPPTESHLRRVLD